jgi:hypothetical protein
MDRAGIDRVAAGWGKVVARRVAEHVGLEPELDADDIEQFAKGAACALAKAAIEEMLEQKAVALGSEQHCPECQRLCPVEREARTIWFWCCAINYHEPKCRCPACRRDFFPSTTFVASDDARLQPVSHAQNPQCQC